MQINKIQNNNYNKTQSPVFGYRLPKNPVTDIRQISHLNCALCNKRMLTRQEIEEIFMSVQESCKKVLNTPEFEKYKNLPFFQFLLNLANKYPKSPLTKISKKPEFLKNITQFKEQDQEIINNIIKSSENYIKPASTVATKFYPIREHMSDENQEVFDILYIYAQKYPDKTFSEILSMPDIQKKHTNKAGIQSYQDHIYINHTYSQLEEIKKHIEPETQKDMEAIIDIIKNKNFQYYQFPLQKEIFFTNILKNIIQISNKYIAEQIKQNIKTLSGNKNKPDWIIQKLCNKNDKQIINYFITPLESTFEHVIAKSKGGRKEKGNGIYLHRYCNTAKGNIFYRKLIEVIPNFAKNEQTQLNKIETFIMKDKLPNDELYPLDAQKNIYKETKSQVALDVSKYAKFLEKKYNIKNIKDVEKSIYKLIESYKLFQAQNKKYSKEIEKNAYYKICNPTINSLIEIKDKQIEILKQIKELNTELNFKKALQQQINKSNKISAKNKI